MDAVPPRLRIPLSGVVGETARRSSAEAEVGAHRIDWSLCFSQWDRLSWKCLWTEERKAGGQGGRDRPDERGREGGRWEAEREAVELGPWDTGSVCGWTPGPGPSSLRLSQGLTCRAQRRRWVWWGREQSFSSQPETLSTPHPHPRHPCPIFRLWIWPLSAPQ